MLAHTEGIVVHTFKYSDTSIITRIFTQEYGLISFMVKGVHSKKSNFRPAYFQPLMVLDIRMYRQEKKSLQNLKEVKVLPHTHSIHSDIIKGSIAIFMAEILYKTLKDGYVNSALYELVKEEIIQLDGQDENIEMQPIRFLLTLSRELGFMPMNNYQEGLTTFSISEGAFVQTLEFPDANFHFSGGASRALYQLISEEEVRLNGTERNELLTQLIQYYQYHLPGMGAVKSQQVLSDVFHA